MNNHNTEESLFSSQSLSPSHLSWMIKTKHSILEPILIPHPELLNQNTEQNSPQILQHVAFDNNFNWNKSNRSISNNSNSSDSMETVYSVDINDITYTSFNDIGFSRSSSKEFNKDHTCTDNHSHINYHSSDTDIHTQQKGFRIKTVVCTIVQILTTVITCMIVDNICPIHKLIFDTIYKFSYVWYTFNCVGYLMFLIMIWFHRITNLSPWRYIFFLVINFVEYYIVSATILRVTHNKVYVICVFVFTVILGFILTLIGSKLNPLFKNCDRLMKICMSLLTLYGFVMIFVCGDETEICHVAQLIYSICGILIMCGYIIKNTQMICCDIYSSDSYYKSDEYLCASLNSYLNVTYIFLFILLI